MQNRPAMVTLNLRTEDAAFLHDQLAKQLTHVEHELVHTDARDMQHELAHDLERLRALIHDFDRAAEMEEEGPAAEQRPPADS